MIQFYQYFSNGLKPPTSLTFPGCRFGSCFSQRSSISNSCQLAILISMFQEKLGGGFNSCLFSFPLGEMIRFNWFFSNGLKPPTRKLISKLFNFYGIWTKDKKISWDFSHAKHVENKTFFGQTSKVSCVSFFLLEFNLSVQRFVSTILRSQSLFSLWFRALKILQSKISMFSSAWCLVPGW